MTRPIRLTARCASCGASCSVRTSSSRCVGFGTNTWPSGSRRGESTVDGFVAAPVGRVSDETSDVNQIRSRSITESAGVTTAAFCGTVSVPASRSSPASPVIENTSSIGPAVCNRGMVSA